MLRRLNLRRSPAMVVAVIALIAALGGSAIAANGLTGTQKKQTRKIATRVFNSAIAGASVARAGVADTATNAKSAETATHAKSADTATHATNADQLGGVTASEYQHKLQGSCTNNGAIAAVEPSGVITCVTPVKAINVTPSSGEAEFVDLGSGLQLAAVCHDGGQVEIVFQDVGSSPATLNWFYSNGTAVSASGTSLAAELGSEAFSFSSARIEGQFIYAVGPNVITVNLHAFDAGSGCEVRGTAEVAEA